MFELRSRVVVRVVAILLAGCGQPQAPSLNRDQGSPAQASGPRGTLKIAWGREPETLSPKFLGGSGNGEFQWTFNSALTIRDFTGIPRPLLAREIPTRDSGDWVVNAGGTMITTFRLQPNARWHDGTPITAGDYVFAYQVNLDKDLPILNANALGFQQLIPLTRQVLEDKYRSNRAAFPTGEEWTTAYVGTGPFRVERWTPGVGIIAGPGVGAGSAEARRAGYPLHHRSERPDREFACSAKST